MRIQEAKTVYDLFNGHPERWLKGQTALDENGRENLEDETFLLRACKFCVLSGIYRIYGTEEKGMEMADKLRDVLPILQITDWQDNCFLTFKKMLSKVKEAGI